MDKKEILEKLARKEISKDEAEQMLNQAGPASDIPPPHQGARQTGGGRRWGCLIGLLVIVLLLLGIPLLLFLGFSARDEKMRIKATEMEIEREIEKKVYELQQNEMKQAETHKHEHPDSEKGDTMEDKKKLNKEIERIRNMAKEGKITNEEAERLIEAMIKSAEKLDNSKKEQGE